VIIPSGSFVLGKKSSMIRDYSASLAPFIPKNGPKTVVWLTIEVARAEAGPRLAASANTAAISNRFIIRRYSYLADAPQYSVVEI